MVNFCSAFNCSSSSDVKNELIFHKLVLILIVVDYLVIILSLYNILCKLQ